MAFAQSPKNSGKIIADIPAGQMSPTSGAKGILNHPMVKPHGKKKRGKK